MTAPDFSQVLLVCGGEITSTSYISADGGGSGASRGVGDVPTQPPTPPNHLYTSQFGVEMLDSSDVDEERDCCRLRAVWPPVAHFPQSPESTQASNVTDCSVLPLVLSKLRCMSSIADPPSHAG